MGNCIIRESSMQWGGDDWGADFPATSKHNNLFPSSRKKKLYYYNPDDKIEERGSLSSPHNDLIINKANTTTDQQVKIKITRKQLEEVLMGRSSNINVQAGQGLSVQELLVAHLINVSHKFDSHQRLWRPALPTITEVN